MSAIRPATKTVQAYLLGRGFQLGSKELERFLSPKLSMLTDPVSMADRGPFAARVAEAVRRRERIVVFGDYDCDGMTATAIMTEGLRRVGAETVTPVLASRFDGGYGLSEKALERVLVHDPNLVITCDCGSSDHERLRQLGTLGKDVLVIDHHLVPDEPLPALAFLNPHRPDCAFPDKGQASCGLALSVLAEVRKSLGVALDLKPFLDLVAIGTIADVAPLVGDNRVLVRAGLSELAQQKRPGLLALLSLLGLRPGETLTAEDVAFRIAPRLNAPGRLGSPDVVLDLLLEQDPERARQLAMAVEHLCERRKEEQAQMLEVALPMATAQAENGAIVVGATGFNHGIVGILAGRIAEQFDCPAIVIGFDEDQIGIGSARAPKGFPLFDAIAECQHVLRRFGGHQAAVGLEIAQVCLPEFQAAFQEACRKRAGFERPEGPPRLLLRPEDDPKEVLLDLLSLEPCGEKNAAPQILLRAAIHSARRLKGGHVKLSVRVGDRNLGAFVPSQFAAQLSDDAPLERGAPFELEGRLRADRFAGGDAVEFLVQAEPRRVESPSRARVDVAELKVPG